jgi:hypothetical protein
VRLFFERELMIQNLSRKGAVLIDDNLISIGSLRLNVSEQGRLWGRDDTYFTY